MRLASLALALSVSIFALPGSARDADAQHTRPATATRRARTPPAPPVPELGDFSARLAHLAQAISTNNADVALDTFLSREAFAQIKAADDPDRYHARLIRMFRADVAKLHASLGNSVQFVRFELSRRRAWVLAGEEANRVPYWAARHNRLVLRVNGREQEVELRVAIAWEGRWFITHLGEFHTAPP